MQVTRAATPLTRRRAVAATLAELAPAAVPLALIGLDAAVISIDSTPLPAIAGITLLWSGAGWMLAGRSSVGAALLGVRFATIVVLFIAAMVLWLLQGGAAQDTDLLVLDALGWLMIAGLKCWPRAA